MCSSFLYCGSSWIGLSFDNGNIGFQLSIILLFPLIYSIVYQWMSYWGITVTINILSVLPFSGNTIAELIWCSSSVIINRIFIFHFFLGIFLGLIILFHIFFLHAFSSSNPLLNSRSTMNIPFYPLLFKDFLIIFLLSILIFVFLFLEPDILGNCDNHNIASPLTTPHNILPESYFSCFHCWLRSFSNKTIGVIVVLILLIPSFPIPLSLPLILPILLVFISFYCILLINTIITFVLSLFQHLFLYFCLFFIFIFISFGDGEGKDKLH